MDRNRWLFGFLYLMVLILLFGCNKADKNDFNYLIDIDGNVYNTVNIGDQTWMAENLKVAHYPDGKEIKLVANDSDWVRLINDNEAKAYCIYNNNNNSEKDSYGALYTYAAAKNVCPEGWHLPNNEEWLKLKMYIGSNDYYGKEGTALKTKKGWKLAGNGTNDFGFSALPGGNRNLGNIGMFRLNGFYGYWWSNSSDSITHANYYRLINHDYQISDWSYT